MVGPIT